jgi:hypothetical protein
MTCLQNLQQLVAMQLLTKGTYADFLRLPHSIRASKLTVQDVAYRVRQADIEHLLRCIPSKLLKAVSAADDSCFLDGFALDDLHDVIAFYTELLTTLKDRLEIGEDSTTEDQTRRGLRVRVCVANSSNTLLVETFIAPSLCESLPEAEQRLRALCKRDWVRLDDDNDDTDDENVKWFKEQVVPLGGRWHATFSQDVFGPWHTLASFKGFIGHNTVAWTEEEAEAEEERWKAFIASHMLGPSYLLAARNTSYGTQRLIRVPDGAAACQVDASQPVYFLRLCFGDVSQNVKAVEPDDLALVAADPEVHCEAEANNMPKANKSNMANTTTELDAADIMKATLEHFVMKEVKSLNEEALMHLGVYLRIR